MTELWRGQVGFRAKSFTFAGVRGSPPHDSKRRPTVRGVLLFWHAPTAVIPSITLIRLKGKGILTAIDDGEELQALVRACLALRI